MTYYHACPHCSRQFRTAWGLRLHVQSHAAGLLPTPAPRPTPLTAKYQARLEGAMLFSAAGQKAGQR